MRNRKLLAAVIAAGVIISTAACSGLASKPAASLASGGTLTLGSIIAPQTFDPAGVGDTNFVPYAQTVYDSLIRRDPAGKYMPMLATDWKIASGNTSVTIHLRKGVTFSDGTAFDATAVKANLEHFKAGVGPLSSELARLNTVEVIDANTVALHYSSPDPDILYNLSDAAGRMASPKALQDSKALAITPVGSGPYIMDSSATVQGSTYTFTARKGYWDKTLQKFAKVVFKIFPDEVSLLNALQSKQVDAANLTSADNRKAAAAAGIKHLDTNSGISWLGMMIFDRNGKIVPALGDQRVRKAIALSFNVPQIQKALLGGTGVPTNQIFSQSIPGYDKSLDGTYTYNVSQAKKLMAEAGYASGFDLTLPINANTAPAAQENFRNSLGALNIRVTFQNLGTVPQYLAGLQSGKFAASPALFSATPTAWRVIGNYVQPAAPWNPFHTTSPELEKLIAEYPVASAGQAPGVVSQISKFLVDNVWFIPWAFVQEQYFVAGKIDVTLQAGQNVPSIYNYAPAAG